MLLSGSQLTPVTNYTAWRQRQRYVRNLRKVRLLVTRLPIPGRESSTCQETAVVRHSTSYATTTPQEETKGRFPFKRNRLHCVRCVNENRMKRSSGNHDWLLANASACVSCGFRLRNARNASDCVWMENRTLLNCYNAAQYELIWFVDTDTYQNSASAAAADVHRLVNNALRHVK